MNTGLEPIGRCRDSLGVSGCTGKIFHTLVGVFAPRTKFWKVYFAWRATIFLESDTPRTVDRSQGAFGTFWQRARRTTSRLSKDNKNGFPRLKGEGNRGTVINDAERRRLDRP